MRNVLADLLESLLANPTEETPRLNSALKAGKIASDIQFVATSLRQDADTKAKEGNANGDG